MYIPQFVYPFIQHVDCFNLLAIMNYPAMKMVVQTFLWDSVFNSVRYTHISGIAESYKNYMLNLGGTVIQFPWQLHHFIFLQCTKVPISLQGDSTFPTVSMSPHPGSHLLLCFLINCKNPILHIFIYLWTIF